MKPHRGDAMAGGGETLSGIELFGGLAARDFEALDLKCSWRSYRANQQIVAHHDDSTDVFFIVSGTVRVVIYSLAGKEIAFRDMAAGTMFGELSAIDGRPRSANVIALADAVVPSMAASVFWQVLRDHPDVSARMLKQLAGLARNLSERVFEFSALGVKNRIHAELLRLARDHGGGGATAVISPPPTHAEIASRVSTHREAVTRELNALDHGGLIERRSGALIISDVSRLARLVDEILDE